MAKFCPTCGKELQFDNAEICPSCGVRILPVPLQVTSAPLEIRSPFLAVVLSFFFAGWGQWYNGKTWDGIKIFGAFLGSYLLMVILSFFTATHPFSVVFVLIISLILLGIWIYGMYDAYKTAERINKKEEPFSRKSGLFWLPVALVVLMIVVIIIAAIVAAFIFGMAGNVS